MQRTFRACPGRTVTLPQSVQAGAGATTMRLDPGCIVTLEEEAVIANHRFINGRVRAGDLEEIPTEAAADAPAPTLVPKPDPSKPMALAVGKPSKESDR